jgi:hypothetical protein
MSWVHDVVVDYAEEPIEPESLCFVLDQSRCCDVALHGSSSDPVLRAEVLASLRPSQMPMLAPAGEGPAVGGA